MGSYKKLWLTLLGVLIVTFSLLGYYGVEIYRQVPPIPTQVSTNDGKVLFTRDDILDGQTAWQSVGGMQLGSIWGHGALQAPDWTADWLHRELMAWLDLAAQEQYGKAYASLDTAAQAALRETMREEYRANGTDVSGVLQVSERRAQAMARHARRAFGGKSSAQVKPGRGLVMLPVMRLQQPPGGAAVAARARPAR